MFWFLLPELEHAESLAVDATEFADDDSVRERDAGANETAGTQLDVRADLRRYSNGRTVYEREVLLALAVEEAADHPQPGNEAFQFRGFHGSFLSEDANFVTLSYKECYV